MIECGHCSRDVKQVVMRHVMMFTVVRDTTISAVDCSIVPPYKLVTKNKAHARIIWDCSWSHDDLLFATGSRDKSVSRQYILRIELSSSPNFLFI